jgi:hypothetical protein
MSAETNNSQLFVRLSRQAGDSENTKKAKKTTDNNNLGQG